jgi:hypothetical protein
VKTLCKCSVPRMDAQMWTAVWEGVTSAPLTLLSQVHSSSSQSFLHSTSTPAEEKCPLLPGRWAKRQQVGHCGGPGDKLACRGPGSSLPQVSSFVEPQSCYVSLICDPKHLGAVDCTSVCSRNLLLSDHLSGSIPRGSGQTDLSLSHTYRALLSKGSVSFSVSSFAQLCNGPSGRQTSPTVGEKE